jgi:hypothetical protein
MIGDLSRVAKVGIETDPWFPAANRGQHRVLVSGIPIPELDAPLVRPYFL